jgi:hypothetical protein
MAVDETRQHSLARDIDHLGAGGNRDVAATTDRLEAALLDHDGGIFDRRTSRAVDQLSTLYYECLFCHVLVSFLVSIPPAVRVDRSV